MSHIKRVSSPAQYLNFIYLIEFKNNSPKSSIIFVVYIYIRSVLINCSHGCSFLYGVLYIYAPRLLRCLIFCYYIKQILAPQYFSSALMLLNESNNRQSPDKYGQYTNKTVLKRNSLNIYLPKY